VAEAVRLSQLVISLQKFIELYGDLKVFMEGCDCVGACSGEVELHVRPLGRQCEEKWALLRCAE